MKQFLAMVALYIIPIGVYTAAIGVPFGQHAVLDLPVWVLAVAAAWLMSALHIGFLKLAIRGAVERKRRGGYHLRSR